MSMKNFQFGFGEGSMELSLPSDLTDGSPRRTKSF